MADRNDVVAAPPNLRRQQAGTRSALRPGAIHDQAHDGDTVLERPRVAYGAMGRSRSAWYDDVARGLMVEPFALGGRAKAIYRYERRAVTAARAAGLNDDAVRELVALLHDARIHGCNIERISSWIAERAAASRKVAA